jgi:hypothetical protein
MKKNYTIKLVLTVLLAFTASISFAQVTIPVTSGGVNNTIQYTNNSQKLAESRLKLDIKKFYDPAASSFARNVYMHFDISSLSGTLLTSGNLNINISSANIATAGTDGIEIKVFAYHGTGLPSTGVPTYDYDFSTFTETDLGVIYSIASEGAIPAAPGVQTLDIKSYLEARRDAGDSEVVFKIEVTKDNEPSTARVLFTVSSDTGAVAPTVVIEGSGGVLSSNNFEISNLKVYPNPVRENLIISNSSLISKANLYDVTGKQVYNANINSKEFKLNVGDLSKGVYLLKLTDNANATTIKRIILE